MAISRVQPFVRKPSSVLRYPQGLARLRLGEHQPSAVSASEGRLTTNTMRTSGAEHGVCTPRGHTVSGMMRRFRNPCDLLTGSSAQSVAPAMTTLRHSRSLYDNTRQQGASRIFPHAMSGREYPVLKASMPKLDVVPILTTTYSFGQLARLPHRQSTQSFPASTNLA